MNIQCRQYFTRCLPSNKNCVPSYYATFWHCCTNLLVLFSIPFTITDDLASQTLFQPIFSHYFIGTEQNKMEMPIYYHPWHSPSRKTVIYSTAIQTCPSTHYSQIVFYSYVLKHFIIPHKAWRAVFSWYKEWTSIMKERNKLFYVIPYNYRIYI